MQQIRTQSFDFNINLLAIGLLKALKYKIRFISSKLMDFKNDIAKRFFTKQDIGGAESINDLRDKEFSGKSLSAEEKYALATFDKYRLQILNSQENEEQFHSLYRQIQVISNLGDWREFLKDEYNT